MAARAAGIYVSIMLWHSFGWENGLRIPESRSWSRHPFNIENNINGVNADVDGDGHGLELGSIGQAFTPFQEAYVRQVVDAVGDLDNVLYEICNECYDTPATNAWQQYFRDFIHTYESRRGLQHPVGMTSLQNFNNTVLMKAPLITFRLAVRRSKTIHRPWEASCQRHGHGPHGALSFAIRNASQFPSMAVESVHART